MKKSDMVFWVHFVVALVSHILVPLMVGGVVNIIISQGDLDFLTKGLLLGITFYTEMYAINHVANDDGFCVLTEVENSFRKVEGKPKVGRFTPRFYKAIKDLYRKIRGAK